MQATRFSGSFKINFSTVDGPKTATEKLKRAEEVEAAIRPFLPEIKKDDFRGTVHYFIRDEQTKDFIGIDHADHSGVSLDLDDHYRQKQSLPAFFARFFNPENLARLKEQLAEKLAEKVLLEKYEKPL